MLIVPFKPWLCHPVSGNRPILRLILPISIVSSSQSLLADTGILTTWNGSVFWRLLYLVGLPVFHACNLPLTFGYAAAFGCSRCDFLGCFKHLTSSFKKVLRQERASWLRVPEAITKNWRLENRYVLKTYEKINEASVNFYFYTSWCFANVYLVYVLRQFWNRDIGRRHNYILSLHSACPKSDWFAKVCAYFGLQFPWNTTQFLLFHRVPDSVVSRLMLFTINTGAYAFLEIRIDRESDKWLVKSFFQGYLIG